MERRAHESIFPGAPDVEVNEALVATIVRVVVSGHSHLAVQRATKGWQIFNPGSIGAPLDGKASASCMLPEGDRSGWHPTFRRVPCGYAPVFREFERQGFVEECGVGGYPVVQTLLTARPQISRPAAQ